MAKRGRGRPKGRGRPYGAISRATYMSLVATHFPKRIREFLPMKKRGRPMGAVQSLQILGGALRVKLAKTRVVRVGKTEVVV